MRRFAFIFFTLSCVPASQQSIFSNFMQYEGIQVASWYGPGFHGRLTASGEVYNMYAYTCASRTYPLGTVLLISPVWDTTKAVIVVVNDRGPYVDGRDLDLSYGVAKTIGLVERGVGKVKVYKININRNFLKDLGGLYEIEDSSDKIFNRTKQSQSALAF